MKLYTKVSKASGFTGIRVAEIDAEGVVIRSITCSGATSNAEADAMIAGLGKTTYTAPANPDYPNSTLVLQGTLVTGTLASIKPVTLKERITGIIEAAKKKDPKAKLEDILNGK